APSAMRLPSHDGRSDRVLLAQRAPPGLLHAMSWKSQPDREQAHRGHVRLATVQGSETRIISIGCEFVIDDDRGSRASAQPRPGAGAWRGRPHMVPPGGGYACPPLHPQRAPPPGALVWQKPSPHLEKHTKELLGVGSNVPSAFPCGVYPVEKKAPLPPKNPPPM